jgi:surfactin synthase thioesterase subunit
MHVVLTSRRFPGCKDNTGSFHHKSKVTFLEKFRDVSGTLDVYDLSDSSLIFHFSPLLVATPVCMRAAGKFWFAIK